MLLGAVLGPHSLGVADGLWSLEVSDRAALRLLTRALGVNLGEAIFLAHQATLMLPTSRFTHPKHDPVLLRASPGIGLAPVSWRGGGLGLADLI